MKKVSGMIYKTNGTKEFFECDEDKSLEKLQSIVGGLIEVIYLLDYLDEQKENWGNGNDLIVNEEGLLLDLPKNLWSAFLTANTRWENEVFRGDIVLINGMLD